MKTLTEEQLKERTELGVTGELKKRMDAWKKRQRRRWDWEDKSGDTEEAIERWKFKDEE